MALDNVLEKLPIRITLCSPSNAANRGPASVSKSEENVVLDDDQIVLVGQAS